MSTYVSPAIRVDETAMFEENEVPVFVAAIGWVLLVFGSAWAYCQAMCGWMNVKECSTSWLQVKAVCKS